MSQQLPLVSRTRPRITDLPDGRIWLEPGFLPDPDELFATLRDEIPWRQDTLRMFGKVHPVPRLHQWMADPGLSYRWSGLTMAPVPWIPTVAQIRDQVSARVGVDFNSVLANLYRDGQDTVGWHADDEPELGPTPTIASISLGATRDFQLRHRSRKDLNTVTLALPPGSLLVMEPPTQAHWHHALPRRKRVGEPRINLTFRVVLARG